jgi:hypothetical protein
VVTGAEPASSSPAAATTSPSTAARSTITISAEKIPANAIILGGLVEVDTAVTSGGAATVAVQVEAANDIVNAAAVSGAPWSTTGRKSVIPAFTGATSVKTTQARPIAVVIAAATLTAGVVDVLLAYIADGRLARKGDEMALKNYKVVQEDGTETYYQFDENDEVGKQTLAALKDAAKEPTNPVKSVTEGDPSPINKGGASK